MRRLFAFALVAVLAGSACTSRPTRTVTVVNNTEYEVVVEVSSRRSPRVPMATLARDTRDVVEEVPDQGDVWVFHFASAGIDAGSLQLSRSVLHRRGWTVTVPADVGARLRAANVAPAPHRPGG